MSDDCALVETRPLSGGQPTPIAKSGNRDLNVGLVGYSGHAGNPLSQPLVANKRHDDGASSTTYTVKRVWAQADRSFRPSACGRRRRADQHPIISHSI
jgi:hypothetical protein